jgi:hypothetical protein
LAPDFDSTTIAFPLLLHVLRDDPREHVGDAAGRIGNDDADGASWKILGLSRGWRGEQQQPRDDHAHAQKVHGVPALVLLRASPARIFATRMPPGSKVEASG